MAEGGSSISVSSGANLEDEGTRNNNTKNHECMRSCLSSVFLRSLSLHDRPRSSRVPTKKELRQVRYKALASSLQKIPSNPSPSSEVVFESNTNHVFDSVGINTETEMTTPSSIYDASSSATHQQTGQNPHSWAQDGYMRLFGESEKLLQKTISILRTPDKVISKSLTELTQPESIALESVKEMYRNKGRRTSGCFVNAEFDLQTEFSGNPLYENFHPSIQLSPKTVQAQSTSRRPMNLQAHYLQQGPKKAQVQYTRQRSKIDHVQSTQQSPENAGISESFTNSPWPESVASESTRTIYSNEGKSLIDCSADHEFDLQTKSSSESIYENYQPSIQLSPKNAKSPSTQQNPKNAEIRFTQRSQKKLQSQSFQHSSENSQVQPSQQSAENASISESFTNLACPESENLESIWGIYSNEGKNTTDFSAGHEFDLQTKSSSEPIYENCQAIQLSPKNVKSHSTHQSSKNSQAQSSQQSPKYSLENFSQDALKYFESLSGSNSANMQSLMKHDFDDVWFVQQSPENLQSSRKISTPTNAAKMKSLMKFDLPSDRPHSIKIIEVLQNRCLEYRKMIQDIAVSVLGECQNFSKCSVSRIRDLRKQFERLKRNFKDFRKLCGNSLVFGPDAQPVDEKVREVIQSFYLTLLQEENETFMSRLDFGLKMGKTCAKMLKFETESKKIITTLETEILYLKKTSVGFKV